jgi:hypothetical protein
MTSSPLNLAGLQKILARCATYLTGALNSGKPIEKPQTDCAGDVKNHFADRNFQLAIGWSRWSC